MKSAPSKMSLRAQSVQSIGDFVLVRIYSSSDEDTGGKQKSAILSDDRQFETGNEYKKRIDQLPSDEVSMWAMTAAQMLQEQWPRQDRDNHGDGNESDASNQSVDEESFAEYYRKLLVHHEESYPCYNLACSYIMLEQDPKSQAKPLVVGHGRLTESYESAGGNAVAATYILIDPKYRGKGYGRTLLCLLEQEAKSKQRLGCDYHFVYLWCKATTAPFYEKSGYMPSKNRVSLQRPCLKALTASSVQSLEDILSRRRRHCTIDPGNSSAPGECEMPKCTKKKLETVILLPSNPKKDSKTNVDNAGKQEVAEDDVWLRKRLVDHVESNTVSEQDRRNELEKFVASTSNTKIVSTEASTNTIVAEQEDSNCCYQYCWNPNVPWQMQIGPTCGLTAIRMIRDYYYQPNSEQAEEAQNDLAAKPSSLLAEARDRGFTDDGEMFDADQLRDLTEDQLRTSTARISSLTNMDADSRPLGCFEVETRETSSLTVEEIDYTIRNGGLWILPYDSNPRTKLPSKFRGIHAHWGVLVGLLYARTTVPQSALDNREDLDMPKSDEISSIGNSVHLIIQHSLSSNWAIAPMEDWLDSNCQLISINEEKFALGNEKCLNLSNKIIRVSYS